MTLQRRSVIALGGALMAGRAYAAVPLITAPVALTMATGEPGGGFAAFGPAWGEAAETRAHVALSYRASGGSAANILLVEQGAAQIGLTTIAVADQAWRGVGTWTGHTKLRGFRALFPVFDVTWQVIVPRVSRIVRLNDLSGQRIGVGPAGGASAALTEAMLAAAGCSPHLLITGLYPQQITLLRRNDIAACAFIGPAPLPVVRTDAAHGAFRLIGVSAAQLRAMRRAVPGLEAVTIPRFSLPGQSAVVASVGSGAIAIGRADLPDALVGALVEAGLRRTGAAGLPRRWIDAADSIAIHPGAVSALRRYGFDVPARLVAG